jgi:hypothetical protein
VQAKPLPAPRGRISPVPSALPVASSWVQRSKNEPMPIAARSDAGRLRICSTSTPTSRRATATRARSAESETLKRRLPAPAIIGLPRIERTS